MGVSSATIGYIVVLCQDGHAVLLHHVWGKDRE
jgi:hypothetical protein